MNGQRSFRSHRRLSAARAEQTAKPARPGACAAPCAADSRQCERTGAEAYMSSVSRTDVRWTQDRSTESFSNDSLAPAAVCSPWRCTCASVHMRDQSTERDSDASMASTAVCSRWRTLRRRRDLSALLRLRCHGPFKHSVAIANPFNGNRKNVSGRIHTSVSSRWTRRE